MSIRPLPHHRHPVCPQCRYDLFGSVHADRTTCPECGHTFDAHDLPRAPRADDWRLQDGLIRVAVMCAVRGLLLMPLWIGAIMVALWAMPHVHGRARAWTFVLVLITSVIAYFFIVKKVSEAAGAVSWLFTIQTAVLLIAIIWVASIIATAIMQSPDNPLAMALLTGGGPIVVGLIHERLIEE